VFDVSAGSAGALAMRVHVVDRRGQAAARSLPGAGRDEPVLAGDAVQPDHFVAGVNLAVHYSAFAVAVNATGP